VSFATDGTVDAVAVHVGDRVRSGDTLARLDASALRAAITSARAALAEARQRLADDEAAQLSGDSANDATDSSPTPEPTAQPSSTASDAKLTSAVKPIGGEADIRAAQRAVEGAQRALDAAIAQVSADIAAAVDACITDTADATTRTVTADDSGTVTGSVATPVFATLLGADTTSTNPEQVAADGSFEFTGLTAGATYRVALVPRTDDPTCASALATLADDQSGTSNPNSVVNAKAALAKAIDVLDVAVASLASGADASPTQPGTPTPTPSSSPMAGPPATSDPAADTPSSNGGSTVSAARIAADTKAIDAARADLKVAEHDRTYARLTSPISGTVAAVNVHRGDLVAASSTSATIGIVGVGTPSVQVDIGIADIDLVHAGEQAQVAVDGRSAPLDAKVSYVGPLNSADTSGSSSTYPVTITLTGRASRLFDGMGASVTIDVGKARGVLSVPISAVHTTGRLHTVRVYADGKATTKQVTLGLQGDERVQITSGLSAGDRVVLADVSAAVPSSDSSGKSNRLGGLTGVGGNGPVVFNGPPPGN
jgi:HlyD family secretion protein